MHCITVWYQLTLSTNAIAVIFNLHVMLSKYSSVCMVNNLN